METLYECLSFHSAFLKVLPYGWAWSTAVEKTLLVKLFVNMTKVQPFSEFQLRVRQHSSELSNCTQCTPQYLSLRALLLFGLYKLL